MLNGREEREGGRPGRGGYITHCERHFVFDKHNWRLSAAMRERDSGRLTDSEESSQ